MKQLISFGITLLILLLIISGALPNLMQFFAWLFTLQYSSPKISVLGGVFVRALTFLVSYGLVGIIFGVIKLFNSRLMRVAYFVISTLLGFVFAYIVWGIEQYYVVIIVVLSATLTISIVGIALLLYLPKRKKKIIDVVDDEE